MYMCLGVQVVSREVNSTARSCRRHDSSGGGDACPEFDAVARATWTLLTLQVTTCRYTLCEGRHASFE